MLCYFLLYNNMNQLYVCIYPIREENKKKISKYRRRKWQPTPVFLP